jgi:hypothetical protein
MECGTLSQVTQAKCFSGEITHPNGDHADELFLRCLVRGFIKLELLKGDTKLNHFALKSKLYLHAIHSAFATLRQLNPARLAA